MTQESYKISILNKIKNKCVILEQKFPFVSDRAIILPHLINKDITLKTSLRNTYKSLKKNNGLSNEINDAFNRFITYRRLYEYKINQDKYIIKYRSFNCIINSYIIDAYRIIFSGIILDFLTENKIDKKYCLENEALDTFIIDYFQCHKKITLFFPIDGNILYDTEKIEESIDFLRNFTKEKINADLIFPFGYESTFIEEIYLKMDKYFKINNISCFIDQNYDKSKYSFLRKMGILYNYVLKGKNRQNIKKISFREYQLKKFFLDFFVKNYIDKIRNLHMNYLEEIIINYKKIFFFTPEDFAEIKMLNDEEINLLKRRLNNLNILYIDFQNSSPYQENFIYFCENYLSKSRESITTVLIYNIGEKNYDPNCYDYIKNKNIEISCKNLEKIIYENDFFNMDNSKNEEHIKTFIDLFFYKEHYLYYSSEVLLNSGKENEMSLEYLSSNISNFDNLVPAFFHNNMKVNIKIYFKSIIIDFIPSNGKVYLKRNKQSPLEIDFNTIEIALRKIISKIAKINSLDGDYYILNNLKAKMKNNLSYSNILNFAKSKTIFRGLDSLYEIYYLHKNFKNFQFGHDIQKKYFKSIILEMKKAKKLKKKKLIIIKLQKGDIFGIYLNYRDQDKSLIFNIENDKIISNYVNNKIVIDVDDLIYKNGIFIKKKFSGESSKEKLIIISLEIYGISLIS